MFTFNYYFFPSHNEMKLNEFDNFASDYKGTNELGQVFALGRAAQEFWVLFTSDDR